MRDTKPATQQKLIAESLHEYMILLNISAGSAKDKDTSSSSESTSMIVIGSLALVVCAIIGAVVLIKKQKKEPLASEAVAAFAEGVPAPESTPV